MGLEPELVEEVTEWESLFLSVCGLGRGGRCGRTCVLCLAGGGMIRSISGTGLGLCPGGGEWVEL